MGANTESLPVKPQGKLEARAPEVIEMLLAGGTERAVAAFFGASPRGVVLFKRRHAEQLTVAKIAAVEQVKHLWITDKVRRLEVLQEVTEMTLTELREFGITVVEEIEAEGVITRTRDYRGTMTRELRGLLKDAAIEEGQIVTPKSGGDTYNIEKAVLIRQVTGSDTSLG